MTTLSGQTPAASFQKLLQVDNVNGVDTTLRNVEDGEGTVSALQISTTEINVNGDIALTGDVKGGVGSGDDLNLTSTSHATKGDVLIDGVKINKLAINLASSGVFSGGALSINTDTTKFDLAATEGQIVDSTTDPLVPVVTEISYGGATAISVTNIITNEFTHIYLTSAGAILQSVVEPTPALRRDNIYIGKIIHTDNVNVTIISNQPEVLINPSNAMVDYWRALGLTVTSGNRVSANGANLSFDRSSGDIHQSGINYATDKQTPNIKSLSSDILASFRYRTQTSTEGSDVTVLSPTFYDNSGTVTAIAGSNNQATNIRVYLFQTGNIRVQYGQQIYSTLSSAVTNLTTEPFIVESNIADNAILLGVISVTKGATSLADSGDAKFSPASKFGEVGAGTGATSVSTFQDVYDNSSQPQIVVSSSGGLQIQDNATPIAAPLLQIQSNAGVSDYLLVDSDGTTLGGDLILEKTNNIGIKVDTAVPTYPWRDIIGYMVPKTSGPNTPAFSAFNGNISAWQFSASDIIDLVYHIPHDYVAGTDVHIHVHWSHNGTAISGNAVFTHYTTYAKGHGQEIFPTEITDAMTYNTVDVATTPQYGHQIDEIPLSASGGSSELLDSDDLEPDGLILCRLVLTTLPTITAGSLFVHTIDVHYQSTNIGTKDKVPNFYT